MNDVMTAQWGCHKSSVSVNYNQVYNRSDSCSCVTFLDLLTLPRYKPAHRERLASQYIDDFLFLPAVSVTPYII